MNLEDVFSQLLQEETNKNKRIKEYRNKLLNNEIVTDDLIEKYDESVAKGENVEDTYYDIIMIAQQVKCAKDIYEKILSASKNIHNDSDKMLSENFITFQTIYATLTYSLINSLKILLKKGSSIREKECMKLTYEIFQGTIEMNGRKIERLFKENSANLFSNEECVNIDDILEYLGGF